ncbi:hypothetical protein GO988_22975 [Hymenobacter sp. HMF4947]|uniref:PRTase-CE domain-containing protein n=1 Tax=Hymenobacter ginkgonis TaxID=2682976 RepID=A0A7K1TLC9_9BACT|nr:hypothetical protein [Hymenobacter ginkgonis]MVN79205.1 hypothetical protein [Hymenobacter ginkgonis]
MDQLIQSIHQTLSDYRADENDQSVRITPAGIQEWILQFEESDRLPILKELDNIFKKRYYSKKQVEDLLTTVVEFLTKEYKFENERDFLNNAVFIRTQPKGKSQSIMLDMLDKIVQVKYSISLAECGSSSRQYSIYLDDILCTGLKLITDTKTWADEKYSFDKTNKQAVEENLTKLIFVYVFIHTKNYDLKKKELYYTSKGLADKHKMYRAVEIDNCIEAKSKIDLIMPVEESDKLIIDYKNNTVLTVNEYNKRYDKTSPEEFYRPDTIPVTEGFFTSPENRKIVERAFLRKGIEILNAANVNNKNMRALGYSIPSRKNFGFGALCFTWRNVPNNAPLVFWYLGGGFIPLFKVRRGNQAFDLDSLLSQLNG